MPPTDPSVASGIYIGMMSGTSLDGVDIAALRFAADDSFELLAASTEPYPDDLREAIRSVADDATTSINAACTLDVRLGRHYADVANRFIDEKKFDHQAIRAIGNHGQTVRHQPNVTYPYTLQLGSGEILSTATGLTAITNFRGADIALGGQGAPLAPAFHQAAFHSHNENRAIINIGGIANVTHLPAKTDQTVLGFDTGPGNTLIDHWTRQHFNQSYDEGGQIASSGTINSELVDHILISESFFRQEPPKSTGTDYFSIDWMNHHLNSPADPADMLATLCELTARSICLGIEQLKQPVDQCFICGGGAHNTFLMQRLKVNLPRNCQLSTTNELGIDPDYVEAIAFAWLARQCLLSRPGNLPSVTQSRKSAILGSIHNSSLISE